MSRLIFGVAFSLGLLLGAAGVAAPAAGAQADSVRVEGRIVDRADGRPVADAVVRLLEAARTTATDREGAFTFRDVAPGAYRLEIRHVAYGTRTGTLTIEGGPVVQLAVELPMEPIPLGELRVEVAPRAPGEEIRRRSGTRRDVAAGAELARAEERGDRVIDVIRRMPGVEVTEGTLGPSTPPPGTVCVHMRRAIRGFVNPRACEMVLLVIDGARVTGDMDVVGELLMSLEVAEFESIELLSPLQAGTTYGLAGSGGAIVLHSRGRGPFRDPARDPEHEPRRER